MEFEPRWGSAAIDLTARDPLVGNAQLEVLADVQNPLCGPEGATRVYGPQKGADPESVDLLERALGLWRGQPLTGLVVDGFSGEIARLERLRLAAFEDLGAARLACSVNPKAMFWRTVSLGNTPYSWKITPRSGPGPWTGALSNNTRPPVGFWKPASMFIIVVLPQPEGPITAMKSPSWMA